MHELPAKSISEIELAS